MKMKVLKEQENERKGGMKRRESEEKEKNVVIWLFFAPSSLRHVLYFCIHAWLHWLSLLYALSLLRSSFADGSFAENRRRGRRQRNFHRCRSQQKGRVIAQPYILGST